MPITRAGKTGAGSEANTQAHPDDFTNGNQGSSGNGSATDQHRYPHPEMQPPVINLETAIAGYLKEIGDRLSSPGLLKRLSQNGLGPVLESYDERGARQIIGPFGPRLFDIEV